MNVKTTKIQLRLNRETLATLSEDRAEQVNGGDGTTITAPSNIYTCKYCPSHTGCTIM